MNPMYFVSAPYFIDHESFNPAEFIAPRYFSDGFDYLIAVTHRWPKPLDPQDADLNYLEVRNRISALIDSQKLTAEHVERIAVFYDYSSIYQNRTVDDLVLYGVYLQMHGSTEPYDTGKFIAFASRRRQEDLRQLYPMLLTANEVYMTKYHQTDFYTRCWCLVEALAGRLCGTLVDRVGPFPAEENLRWYREFAVLADRLDRDLDDRRAVAAFEELVGSAACTVENDREFTKGYVCEIVNRVREYRADTIALRRDRQNIQQTVLSRKSDAVRWAQRGWDNAG